MKYGQALCASLLLAGSTSSYGAATDGLWVCPDPSGVDNVVSSKTAPNANCQPYSVDRIKPKQSTSAAPSQPISAPKPAPTSSQGGTLTVSNTPPAGVLPAIPKPLDFSNVAYAPPIMQPRWESLPALSASYRNDATKIYLCTVNGKSQVTESKSQPSPDCTLMGAKGDAASLRANNITAPDNDTTPHLDITVLKAPEAPISTTDVAATPQMPSSDSEKIYLCQDNKGNQSIIQSTTPPAEHCELMGVTSEGNQAAPTVLTAPAQKSDSPVTTENTATRITTTDSQPGDIYKCYDANGLPSFVNEKQRSQFRRCTFFSRSFANVTKTLHGESDDTPLPDERAQGSRLLCSGAGEVSYDGEVRAFECATRSYDHTPGSSGGEIRVGDRYLSIAAYEEDYLNTSGSCGGTITSANGRVLHLEPTKNCPEAFQIAAREIAQAVRAGLNINVSGAFIERQRGLSAQINRIANEVGVDVYLVHAVISAESAYKSQAVSHAGAQGLMQLMPPTARRFNVTNPFHTGQNIRGGATYLKWLLNKFNGNMQLAIAGYNAGEGNVIKYGYKIPPFIETKAYVPKVMQYYRRYRNNPALIGL